MAMNAPTSQKTHETVIAPAIGVSLPRAINPKPVHIVGRANNQNEKGASNSHRLKRGQEYLLLT